MLSPTFTTERLSDKSVLQKNLQIKDTEKSWDSHEFRPVTKKASGTQNWKLSYHVYDVRVKILSTIY